MSLIKNLLAFNLLGRSDENIRQLTSLGEVARIEMVTTNISKTGSSNWFPSQLAIIIAVFWFVSAPLVYAADNMKAFPPAEEGMVRHVINLPEQEEESDYKVELIIGKTVKIDEINRYFYSGTLETENIPGWGFERYILRKLGPIAGTLMAVDPNAPKVERFISLGGKTLFLRYNSSLPLVIYLPTGVEVTYRVWQVEPVARFVQKLALPSGQTAIVAEGDFEARSIGSYSVRLYSKQPMQADKGVTFFSAGLICPRDGTIGKIFLAALRDGAPPSLIVTIRSVGSGAYLSADAFSLEENNVVHITSVSGLPPSADPIVALKASMQVR